MNTTNNTIKTILISTLSAVVLMGCNTISVRGHGPLIEQSYEVNSVTEVDVRGSGQLIIQNGTEEQFVVIAQNDIIEYLEVRQVGERLIIKPQDGVRFKTDEPIKYILTTNNLSRIDVSGAINVSSVEYRTHDLTLDASGATDVDLTLFSDSFYIDASGAFDGYLAGETESFSLDVSGASDLNALDFSTYSADIDISGASKVLISVSDNLSVSASGASSVGYRGNPRVSQSSAGASSVYSVE